MDIPNGKCKITILGLRRVQISNYSVTDEAIYQASYEEIEHNKESIILSDVIIKNNGFCQKAFNSAMKEWAIKYKMLESTVIGPSTRKYLTAIINEQDPIETAKTGNTNGSAMRVAPIGIKYYNDIDKCIYIVYKL